MLMAADLYRLMTWLSPSFPVGAYSFSHGLECAIEQGLVGCETSTRAWIADLLAFGDGHADLVFLAAAWSAAGDEMALREVHELALAFQPSEEIRLESTAQGAAFLKVVSAAWPWTGAETLAAVMARDVAYPVAVGVVARGHGVAREATLAAYGHAFVANLVSAAVRLIPLGQTEGQRITAALEPDVADAARLALRTPPDRVTSSCFLADICSMQHESQYTRLFRS